VSRSGSTITISSSGSYASSTHVHGNITNPGYIGTTANLVVVTGTGGIVQTIAASYPG
jgi:hypothetical protein